MLLSNIFTRSGIFRHLFVVLHLRWIHSITNSSTYNYQTLAKWNFWNLSVSCISHFYIIFWYYVRYNYSNFPQTDGGFELESTINLLLQTKRLIAQVRHSHAIHVRVKNTRQFWWLEGLTLWLTSTSYFYHEQSVFFVMLNDAQ